MATIADLGKEYAEYLENNAKNRNQSLAEIVRRISSLTYTNSKRPISKEDRIQIVDEISKYLLRKKEEDGYIIVESVDSSSYIELINSIRNQVAK